MVATAFAIGFFTALGWWSASKITDQVDKQLDQPKIEKRID